MQRRISFAINEYYHLYNRGNDKRVIFKFPNDYNRFVALLYIANSTVPVDISRHFSEGRTFAELLSVDRVDTLVDIGAYCLMPNHFHILAREKRVGGISDFMKKLSTAYSMYFNKKHSRTGALFEGRFKAKHANTDNYLKYLFSYIHLNPIKLIDPMWKDNGIQNRDNAREFLNSYRHSSYLDYVNNSERLENRILTKESFPKYFETIKEFDEATQEWLNYKEIQ